MSLQDCLLDMDAALTATGIRHCLIGGIATSIHGIPRYTDDIDFMVLKPDLKTGYDRLVSLLESRGYATQYLQADLDDPIGDVVRINKHSIRINLICTRYEYEYDFMDRIQSVTLFNRAVNVININDLVILKLRAGGIQDVYDVAGVIAVNGDRLDLDYLARMVGRIGAQEKWETAQRLALEVR